MAQESGLAPNVEYAPDVVAVGRLFMVALKVPIDTPEIAVTLPAGAVLLDQTRLPAHNETRRFYFRCHERHPQTQLVFGLPDRRVNVPLTVWSFDDLRVYRELKGTPLPRRWPLGEALPELKEAQVFPTGAEVKTDPDAVVANPREEDELIWSMQPDTTIPRWHWTNLPLGCPVHGKEIYAHGAYYPWKMNGSAPYDWKITCPVGGESYPSNDFANGDMTGGDFIDDGIGGGYVQGEDHYGFIAELSQFYCRRMMSVAPSAAANYVATGDRHQAHRALVALCRLAVEYAYLATMTQHRHRDSVSQVERFGQGRFDEGPCLRVAGFTTYNVEQPGSQQAHAVAYDRIWPVIDADPDIVPFLQSKGFGVQTGEDVRRFIEENLFAVWLQGSMDEALNSNEPWTQEGFVRTAEILNYRRGDELMNFLYFVGGYYFTPMAVFCLNSYFRDGAPYESTGGYNGAHVEALGPVVETIERLRKLRPEVYPEKRFPSLTASRRYRNVLDFSMDTVTIDRWYPNVGDDGGYDVGFPAYKPLPRRTWQNGGHGAFEHAYRMFKDPKFAWALARDRGWRPSGGFPYTREQIEAEADKWPDDWNDASSLHDGYGLGILRGGKGDDKRALWMMYGRYRSHTQDDMLDIGLQGYQGVFLSHMGYPRNWGCWEGLWSSHHVARQFPYQNPTAQCHLFADAGVAHVVEARAQHTIDRVDQGQGYELPPDDWQRRMLVLVDVGPKAFYGVDFHRISGGNEHRFAFHCQEGEIETAGLDLTRQETGTLAGPDIPYGDEAWMAANGCRRGGYGWSGLLFALPHLYNVQKAPADQPWSVDWALKTGEGLHLKLHSLGAPGSELAITDGKSPAGGSPYEMKWLMLHRPGQTPTRTQLCHVLEPYWNTPLIEEVQPLALSGEDEPGFSAQGVVVQLGSQTDTLLQATEPHVERQAAGGMRFAGRFGLWREENGVPVAISLVGGTLLSKGGYGVSLQGGEYRGRITVVDRPTETITISPAPPEPAAMVGAHIFLGNSDRQVAYKVLETRAVNGGAQLRLYLDSRVGTGRVTGVQDGKILTDTPFIFSGYRYYLGARVVPQTAVDGASAEYRIIDARDQKAVLIDPAVHPEATASRLAGDFATGEWFDIYDYGVGDDVVWPYPVSVTKVGEGMYHVTSPVPVTLTLPDGARRR